MCALGIAMPGQAFRDPGLDVPLRVADLAARDRIAEDCFERYALIHDIDAASAVHLPVSSVVYHQLVVGIVERETLRDAFDRVGQPGLGLRSLVARLRKLLRAQLLRALKQRPIAIEIGVCSIDGCYERLQRNRYFVLDTEVLSELAS